MEESLYRMNPWWTEEFEAPGIERKKYIETLLSLKNIRDIVLVVGLRRVGKTTILYQTIAHIIEDVGPERILYVSLDNFALRKYSILEIVDEYRRIHGLSQSDFVHLFLDEVHLKEDYERQLKNLYDMGHAKIWASGSASLDISMRSPYLTGRQRPVRVYPLTFQEFLVFKGKNVSKADAHLYPGLAEKYVKTGGIPEYVLTEDVNYLQSLLDGIIYRDVAGRHGIKNPERVEEILSMIAQGVGAPLSIRKISRVLGMSKDDVGRIISLFSESNLVHPVEKEGKVSERKAAPKKIYLADTGLFSVLTEDLNTGSIVENAVYLNLIQRGKKVRYYRKSGKEIDFVSKSEAWESKYRDDVEEKDMELLASLRGYGRKTIITKKTEGKMGEIDAVPLWKFLKSWE